MSTSNFRDSRFRIGPGKQHAGSPSGVSTDTSIEQSVPSSMGLLCGRNGGTATGKCDVRFHPIYRVDVGVLCALLCCSVVQNRMMVLAL